VVRSCAFCKDNGKSKNFDGSKHDCLLVNRCLVSLTRDVNFVRQELNTKISVNLDTTTKILANYTNLYKFHLKDTENRQISGVELPLD